MAESSSDRSMRLDATRTSTLWSVVAVGAVLLLLMLVFVAQNSDPIEWQFLWFEFTISGGLAVLFGVVAGALLVLTVGVSRLLQVRVATRRHRRLDEQPRPAEGTAPPPEPGLDPGSEPEVPAREGSAAAPDGAGPVAPGSASGAHHPEGSGRE